MSLNFKNNVTECKLIHKYIKINTKIMKFKVNVVERTIYSRMAKFHYF